jgi:predicted RNase H-like HicB family nuclease
MNIDYETLSYYLNLQYPVLVYPEATEVIYSVMIPQLPGCMSQGKSLSEAFSNLDKARKIWITTAWNSGRKIPLPNH